MRGGVRRAAGGWVVCGVRCVGDLFGDERCVWAGRALLGRQLRLKCGYVGLECRSVSGVMGGKSRIGWLGQT